MNVISNPKLISKTTKLEVVPWAGQEPLATTDALIEGKVEKRPTDSQCLLRINSNKLSKDVVRPSAAERRAEKGNKTKFSTEVCGRMCSSANVNTDSFPVDKPDSFSKRRFAESFSCRHRATVFGASLFQPREIAFRFVLHDMRACATAEDVTSTYNI